jgi:hypothetical protein
MVFVRSDATKYRMSINIGLNRLCRRRHHRQRRWQRRFEYWRQCCGLKSILESSSAAPCRWAYLNASVVVANKQASNLGLAAMAELL